ncbi:sugar phosphate isomerase/epimerase family protein [Larkinella soli]|uniref:sugar phosphate isomerase/epimerase family protein n=1 Tax=Larkinella soli TaxID=1770527 RepID=UPI000FFCA430|nr:sugar phosphate isomerase/epimerase family protein [Larkinella soli]
MSSVPFRRRDVIKGLMAAGLTAGLPQSGIAGDTRFRPADAFPSADPTDGFSIHIFSKLLHFLNPTELAAVSADLGFDGVDLTVRPGGHVEPERVREDLPKVVEVLHKKNQQVLMMTTALTGADDPAARPTLETARKLSIRYYRTGWLKYPENQPIRSALQQYRRQLGGLAKLNQEFGLLGGYQNHAGTNFGSSVWDLAGVLQEIDSPNLGCQYDIRHATVEGGTSWPTGLRIIQPYVRSVAVKDMIWEKTDGRWRAVSVPLGQGMVDFPGYFAMLKQFNLRVPISLHLEYPLGGADQGSRTITVPKEKVFQAMASDLKTLKAMLRTAGLAG